MTKGEHRDKVVVLLAQYAPLLKVSSQIIDQFVEYGVRRVWRELVVAQESQLRVAITVAHNDPLPADWTAYGNRAFYTLNGKQIPIRWIPIDMLPLRRVATYNHATPTQPDFYSSDQQVRFLPDTTMLDPTTLPGGANFDSNFPNGKNYAANLSAVTLYYYPRPAKTFGDNIPDATDDGLPAFSASYVHRAAAKRALEYFVSGPKRKALAEQSRKESLESIGNLFVRLQQVQDKEVREAT